MQKRRILSRQGISLLEVLISMLILALGILGLAPMLALSIDSNSLSRDFSIAGELAKEKLEIFERVDSTLVTPYVETENELRGRFTRLTYITDHASDSLIPDNVLKVDVMVSWSDDGGMSRTSQMSTLVRKE